MTVSPDPTTRGSAARPTRCAERSPGGAPCSWRFGHATRGHSWTPIQGSASQSDIGGDVQPVKRQLVDDVVRDLVSRYPGTIQSVNLPTPDSALVRLHRGDSTWLVSIARLEVSDGT